MSKKKKNSKAQRAQQAKIAAAKGEQVVKTKKPAKETISYQKYVKKSPVAEFFKKNWKLAAIIFVVVAALVVGGIFLGSKADNGEKDTSASDVSKTDLEWPVNKFTLLVPEPKYDFRIIEYAEDTLSATDANGGTAESFYILISDFAADDVIRYLEDLNAAGFTVQGPDPTLAASGISLYIAEGKKASMGIYLYGEACMLSIIPGTITEEGINQ